MKNITKINAQDIYIKPKLLSIMNIIIAYT